MTFIHLGVCCAASGGVEKPELCLDRLEEAAHLLNCESREGRAGGLVGEVNLRAPLKVERVSPLHQVTQHLPFLFTNGI